jgi:hypothetical protein
MTLPWAVEVGALLGGDGLLHRSIRIIETGSDLTTTRFSPPVRHARWRNS